MPKVSYVQRIANCGHSYMGYTHDPPLPHCVKCMTTMRLNMQAENRHRAWLLAQTQPRPSYYIPRSVRLMVYERDAWTCQLCTDPVDRDLPATDTWSATLDHIVCRSWTNEPDHSADNLRLAHRWCNAVRGDEGLLHERVTVSVRPPGWRLAS